MKHAKQVAQAALSQPQIESSRQSQSVTPQRLGQKLLDTLWTKMAELYGHRWTASFGMTPSSDHAWASALAGLTGEQIACGLVALSERGDDWPPSAPEFRKLCTGNSAESLGLPSVDQAYRQACAIAHPAADRAGVHPVVYHAACETGFYELQHLAQDKSRKLFERAYSLTVKTVMAGGPLREIPKALPETVSVRTPEKGREGIAALRAAVGGSRA